MMGRGSAITFGKISLASDAATLDELFEKLGNILKTYGYPTESGLSGDEAAEFDDELEKMKQSVEQEEGVVFAPEDDARGLSAVAGVSDLDVDVPRDELIDELVTTKKVRPWARKKV
jgi:hypothetical protein